MNFTFACVASAHRVLSQGLRGSLFLAIGLLVSCSSDKVRIPAELEPITPALSARQIWQVKVGSSDKLVFKPAAAGDTVYAAAADGTLLRVDAVTGQVVWRIKADNGLTSGPGTDGSRVVVGNGKGQIFAFDGDGRPLWRETVGSEILTPPLVGKGLVIVRTIDNRVIALDAQNGRRVWLYQRAQTPLALRTAFGMAFAADGLITGFPGGKLGALALSNGALRWETTVSYAKGFSELERLVDVAGMPSIVGTRVCAAAFQGQIGCFALRDGTPEWTREFSSATGTAQDIDYVYASDEKSYIHAFAASDGRPVWRNPSLVWRHLGEPSLVGRALVVGDFEGVLHFLSRTDGKFIARLNTDGSPIVSAPVLAGRVLIVQTTGGSLYGFEPD